MIGKILIEINRLKNELDGYSAKEGLDYIKSYINTLSKQQVKEPDKSLEEAAESIYKTPFGTRAEDFIAGAEWQREDMLKNAFVDNYVVHDGRIELEGDPLPCLNPIILLPYPQFKPYDKVRIVVLKEEE